MQIPGDEYKALIDFGIKCQTFANTCGSRVKLYEQYRVMTDQRIAQLTEDKAQLEAEKESRIKPWVPLLLGIVAGGAGAMWLTR